MIRLKTGAICVLLLISILFISAEALTVYMKDGTSWEVSKIVFSGANAELFTLSGPKVTVPADGIDYDSTGIVRPKGNATIGGADISGQRTGGNGASQESAAPAAGGSQQKLQELWNQTSGSAMTSESDIGSIHKGDEGKILSQDAAGNYMVLTRNSQGVLRRNIVETGNLQLLFPAYFKKVEPPRPLTVEPAAPVVPEPSESAAPAPATSFPSFQKTTPPEEETAPPAPAKKGFSMPKGGWMIPISVLVGAVIGIALMTRSEPAVKMAGRAVLSIVILGGGFYGYAEGRDYYYKDNARGRVKSVFVNFMKGGQVNLQTAICLWYAGVVLIDDSGLLGTAMDKFEEWAKPVNLYAVKQWEITDVKLDPRNPNQAYVTVELDGEPHVMFVPKGRTIEWADE